MATHLSKIPWTEEPGGLQSKGSEATEWLTFGVFSSQTVGQHVGHYGHVTESDRTGHTQLQGALYKGCEEYFSP